MMIRRTNGPLNIVADHSRWDMVTNFEIAQTYNIHRLITDQELDAQELNSLKELSVEVLNQELQAPNPYNQSKTSTHESESKSMPSNRRLTITIKTNQVQYYKRI
jgi:hypothetical protein